MIYVFHGEDDFSSAEALTPLLEAVGTPDLREANVTRMDASEYNIERFGAAAMVVPFLADRRVVVVRGLLGTVESQRTGRRGRRPKAEGPAAGLAPLLAELPPTTDVVFVDGKVSAANPVLAEIKELGAERVVVREFPPLRRDALGKWARDRAASKGATIDNQAVSELTELVGPDLWAMDGELEKLSIYCGDRPITVDDVRALVTSNRESSVFDLVDAIMDRRPSVAMEVTERLFRGGSTGPYLITMIARQARMVAIAQELAARKAPQSEWGQRLGTNSDFVVRKASEQARRFTPEAVRGLFRLVLEADTAMKTGETTEELALTELLARAGTLGAAPRPASRPR